MIIKKRRIGVIETIICLIFISFLFVFYYAIDGVYVTGDREGAEITERSLKNAAVTCYAIEGRYPEDIGYLIENYNTFIDTERYLVHYAAIAPNLMPDIKVIPVNRRDY